MLGEGIAASAIEAAATEAAGMSVGPLALLDEWSLEEADRLLHEAEHGETHGHDGHGHHDHGHHDHGHHGHEHHGHEHHGHEHHGHEHHDHEHHDPEHHDHEHHGHAHREHGSERHAHADQDHRHDHAPRPGGMTEEAVYVLEKMAHGFGRMGRKAGRGFYDYDDEDGEAPELWPGLKAFERRRVSVAAEDLRDRLLLVQVIEALRCLQEGVVDSTKAADESAVRDFGFPRSPGGPFALAKQLGPAALARRARELAARYGDRFEPPPVVLEHAERGQSFEGVLR